MWSATSNPAATSESSSTDAMRGETASRTPASGRAAGRSGSPSGDEALSAVSAERRSGPAIARSSSRQSAASGPSDRRDRVSRQRDDPCERDETAGGLDRRRATTGGWDPKRAGGVGAGGSGNHACREGGRRSRRSTPRASGRGPTGLPTWSVVPPAANSWVWRWPRSTMPAAESRLQTSQSSVGTSSEQPARGSERLAGDAAEVLEPDRDAGQWRSGAVASGRPASPSRSSARAAAASASSS